MKNARKASPDKAGPYNTAKFQTRFVMGIPTTGTVRYEWAVGRYATITPVNWSAREIAIQSQPHHHGFGALSPVGYHVDEARNIIVRDFLGQGAEWLFFLDHDVILKPDIWLTINEYLKKGDIPVLSGLYYAKGSHPEPLLFRGMGNGPYMDWKRGDKVWVDGIPMGLTLIHHSILRWCYDNAEPYKLPDGQDVRRVFHTPRDVTRDPQTGMFGIASGTEDLWWCQNVIKNGVFKKTGWKDIAKKKFPFLCDTGMFSQHIDLDGIQYPANIGIT